MINESKKRIEAIIENGLYGHVPSKDIKKVHYLVNLAEKQFEEVFGKSKSEDNSGIVGLEIDVWSDDIPNFKVANVAYKKRVPIDSGPRPRKPIRCGGEKCYTIKLGSITIRICIIYEGPCNQLSF